MTITLAFQKIPDDNIISKVSAKVIRWKTKSKYFHVEMIVNNKWISTSPSDGAVYVKDLHELSDKYNYVKLYVDGRKVKRLWKFIEAETGKKYDWAGLLLNHLVDMNIDDKDKWFCSEIVAEMLKRLGETLELPSYDYDPGMLYNIYKDTV